MPTLTIIINGTDTNPYERWGFDFNPFPQIGKAEYDAFEQKVMRLDGKPIRGEQDIRERLKGCDPKFIEGCIARYQPGKRTQFTFTFPDAS